MKEPYQQREPDCEEDALRQAVHVAVHRDLQRDDHRPHEAGEAKQGWPVGCDELLSHLPVPFAGRARSPSHTDIRAPDATIPQLFCEVRTLTHSSSSRWPGDV